MQDRSRGYGSVLETVEAPDLERFTTGLQRHGAERHDSRAGVNTGTAVADHPDDGAQRDYTVLGDTVNVASHIEALAPVGSVAISDATRRAVPGARVVSLGPVTLKTRTEPLEIWRLDGLED